MRRGQRSRHPWERGCWGTCGAAAVPGDGARCPSRGICRGVDSMSRDELGSPHRVTAQKMEVSRPRMSTAVRYRPLGVSIHRPLAVRHREHRNCYDASGCLAASHGPSRPRRPPCQGSSCPTSDAGTIPAQTLPNTAGAQPQCRRVLLSPWMWEKLGAQPSPGEKTLPAAMGGRREETSPVLPLADPVSGTAGPAVR